MKFKFRSPTSLRRATLAVFLGLALLAASCGGGGGGGDDGFSTSDYQLLYALNAVQLGGHTIRWPNLPLTVSAGAFPNAQAAFNRWVSASDGAVRFAFSGGSNISAAWSNNTAWCGLCTVRWNSAGHIIDADILVARNQNGCRDGADSTLTHEAGHAIGFLGHTSSGLMNPFGGGEISGAESRFVKLLYSMAPGTDITGNLPQQRSETQSRYDKNGRKVYSMTIQ